MEDYSCIGSIFPGHLLPNSSASLAKHRASSQGLMGDTRGCTPLYYKASEEREAMERKYGSGDTESVLYWSKGRHCSQRPPESGLREQGSCSGLLQWTERNSWHLFSGLCMGRT